jgi:hypothetical protein
MGLLILPIFALPLNPRHGSEIRLPLPLDRVHEPTYIYATPSNGGVLFTEPDGKTVRFLYRPYPAKEEVNAGSHYEGGGSAVYQDITTDGGQTWRLREKVFETEFQSNGDIAYMHPAWDRNIRSSEQVRPGDAGLTPML